MYLTIDSSRSLVSIGLLDKKANWIAKNNWKSTHNESELLLREIEIMMKDEGATKNDILGIIVNAGPGSYTALRVALSTANLFAYSLNIPIKSISARYKKEDLLKIVNNLKGKFEIAVLPTYLKPAHITRKKQN